MPRQPRNLQISFAGGEMSPEMWGRFDDARQRAGVAIARNMVTHARGNAVRRPGFALVRACKSSAHAVRLLRFRYSVDQTMVLEMGRATIDSRDIGYFRFHTGGATLLQPRPNDYRAPGPVSSINTGTDEFNIGVHNFATGDPVVLTMEATTDVVTFPAGATISNVAHGFNVGESVLFRTNTTLPPQLTPGRIYFIVATTANTFEISTRRGGPSLIFTTPAPGTHKVACLPNPSGKTVNFLQTYYAIDRGSPNIALAETKADAMAGVAFNWTAGAVGTIGLTDLIIHYDYRNGDSVFYSSGGSPYYCHRIPWGNPNFTSIDLLDHLDHPPTNTSYWMRQSGASSAVTATAATDRINWTAHGQPDGSPVTITTTGTMPAPLVAGTVYYVRNSTANDFQLSETLAGPIIDITTAGTGTHTAFANGFYEVAHFYEESALFELDFNQSNDVITLTHRTRPAAELSRLGPAHWALESIVFNSKASPPTNLNATVFAGEGQQITSLTAATTSVITTTSPHNFAGGETVQCESVADIPDGQYIVATTPAANTLTLKQFESGAAVGSAGPAGPFTASRIRPQTFTPDPTSTYVVTTLDEDGEESAASSQVVATNNLTTLGSYNDLAWDAVAGAMRYRVYKQISGLFGFIGETVAPSVTFHDDNIAPDLSITPPILDQSLRRGAVVTFDTSIDVVLWTAHGLAAGSPVVFESNGTLPTGIEHQHTYYVLNPETDSFQITTDPASTTFVNLTGSPTGTHRARSGLFPATCCHFEQRRVFAGPDLAPQDFWLTAASTESDLSYSLPSQASDRIHDRVAALERSQILYAVPSGRLLFLTSAAEYRLTPLDDVSALAPGSIAARVPTHIGSVRVKPALANNNLLFVGRDHHLIEYGFLDRAGDYIGADTSLRAEHLFEDRQIVQVDYGKAPKPIVWVVRDDGQLLGLSYMPEEQVAGWHRHDLAGALVESVTVVTEGAEDRVYVVTNRGGTRYVERMGSQRFSSRSAALHVDFALTYSGTPVTSLFVPHLANQAVQVLADGVALTAQVSSAGILTLATAASVVAVGLAMTSQLQTLPLGLQLDQAVGSGRTRNVNKAWLRLSQSGPFQMGPDAPNLLDSPEPDVGQLFTGMVDVTLMGRWDDDGQVLIEEAGPLPLNIVGLTLEVATGA